ncbi:MULTISPECIES: CGNR zinc finger domain-containing protein [Luteimonas]|uniref:CGNR zinc finger domain-containing protein n=1 Tax=Luteimonas TaxID=83614 RepID=UPI0018ED7E87|nr:MULTISPECIES: ABATE domain-containing protein [Luteimonas]
MTEARDAAGHVDHLALDLLNTEARSQGGLIDHWATAADVVRWLARHGIGQAAGTPPPSGLLAQGRTLRARVRALVVARKAGDHPDLAVLNEFLHRYVTAPSVKRTSDGGFALARTACSDAVPALLGPVAEAAAQLLVEGDFALVRQCEHPDCILWFYDRTKSHKRRWCSMAQCGNRQKAATFRARSARGPRASA